MFVIDLKTEAIAVREAQRLRIPIIGLVDTNCDPDGIDYVIPGNDDAIRACNLITAAIGDVVQQGRQRFRAEEEAARAEAEAQARRDAEERARREAEEQAAKEAEQALTQGGEGMGRQEAEQVVADAVQELGRPMAEGRRAAEAGAAAQAADEPAMPSVSGTGPGDQELKHNPNVGDRVPQEAGARQGEGAPASDTVEPAPASAGEAEPRARKPRAKARKEPAADTPAAPSEAAQEAMTEAPPADAAAPAAEPAAPAADVQDGAASGDAPDAVAVPASDKTDEQQESESK
jgi:small subunit ribosomal protein S2